jgi:hypothetical protein
VSLCATRCHRARLSCRRRATPQTPADVPGFPAPVPHRSSSEQPCTAKVRGSAREVCVARWYDPATAEFTSVDPEVAQTGQPYAYADDNSVSEADPSGLWTHGYCLDFAAGAVNDVSVEFLGCFVTDGAADLGFVTSLNYNLTGNTFTGAEQSYLASGVGGASITAYIFNTNAPSVSSLTGQSWQFTNYSISVKLGPMYLFSAFGARPSPL